MPDYDSLLKTAYGSAPDEAVRVAIEVYKDAGKYLNDVRKQAKQIITDVITETGQVEWSTKAGKVYLPKPSVSVRYDTKALDALCASDEDLKRILSPHRVETERAGSLTIR